MTRGDQRAMRNRRRNSDTTHPGRKASPGDRGHPAAGGSGWWRDKAPILRFLLVFGALMALFYAVFYLPPHRFPRLGRAFESYLSLYARAAGGVLNLLGQGVSVSGQEIVSPRFAVQVVRGCDAMEAKAILVAAMLASPVPLRRKAVGIVGGVLLLAIVNLVRIVSLFFVGIHWRARFDAIHLEVWQPVFILLAVGAWLIWAVWARGEVRSAECGVRNERAFGT